MKATLFGIMILVGHSSSKTTQKQYEMDFKEYDTNKDGYVDPIEIRTVHAGISYQNVNILFIAADLNEDGLLDMQEYVQASS